MGQIEQTVEKMNVDDSHRRPQGGLAISIILPSSHNSVLAKLSMQI